jgi:hypothetical protein
MECVTFSVSLGKLRETHEGLSNLVVIVLSSNDGVRVLAEVYRNSQSDLANAVAGPQTGEEWGWCHKTCFMTLSYIKNYLYFCSIIKRCSVIQVQKSEDTSLLSCQLQFCSIMHTRFCSIRALVRSWSMDFETNKNRNIYILFYIFIIPFTWILYI